MNNAIKLPEQSFIVIFLVIVIGVICQKRKIINQTQVEGFEIFLFKIAMPCYLFTSTLNHDLTVLLNTKYILSYMITFLIIAGLASLYFYKTSSKAELYMKILASGYVNTAIYTLPVIAFLLKDPSAVILSNLLQVVLIQSFFITMISLIKHKEKSLTRKLMSILSTPMIVMPVLGLFCNHFKLMPYPIIKQTIQNLGSGSMSIALFTFGLTLGAIQITKQDLDRNILAIIGIKNILHPMIAFIIGNYIFHLEYYWLYSLIITASAPTGFIVYIIAKQFSIEQVLIKKAVTLSSLVSLGSLVLIMFIPLS